MVPEIAKAGHSFKGAFAYYLHDKRQEQDAAHPATAERVAWVVTRNLATDDPHAAARIMIATAKSADELKKAAGIKASGRKSNSHVYAYSLAWHPEETGSLSNKEMLRAVDVSLKRIGAEEHQVVIVRHQDEPQPHVHVIINRVHPETGLMLKTDNDRYKLGDWALEYRRERGEELKYCPKREEKRKARAAFQEASGREERPGRTETPAKPEKRATEPEKGKSAASMLKELSDAQKVRHKSEWPALSAQHKAAKDQIYSHYGAMMKQSAADHAATKKAVWRGYFKGERAEVRAFQSRESELVGIIRNALEATRHQFKTGTAGNRGALALTFANVLSAQARAAAFDGKTSMKRAEVAATLKTVLDGEIRTIREKRGAALTVQREQFGRDRAALIERQTAERAKVREAWKQVYEGRGKTTAERARPGRERLERKTQWQAERQASSDARIERAAIRPEYSRPSDRAVTAAQRKETIREATPTARPQDLAAVIVSPESQPVKQDFDNARRAPTMPIPKAPHVPTFVQQATPQPTPAGEVRPTPRTLQNVPEKPAPVMPVVSQTPAVKRDFSKLGTPTTAAPASSPAQAATPAQTPATMPAMKRDFSALKPATPSTSPEPQKPTRRPSR